MCSSAYMTFILFISLTLLRVEAQGIKSVRFLDILIRDYTFKIYDKRFKTGTIHTVTLPTNLSGITVDAARFRCGSIKRYGAQVKEFHLGPGVSVVPCLERVMVVIQSLSSNWCSLYKVNDLAGYEVVSPILGLLAYSVGNEMNLSSALEADIQAGTKPITITFQSSTTDHVSASAVLCASFEAQGKVAITNTVFPFVCETTRQGHYALVVRTSSRGRTERKMSLKKVVIGTSIGAILGVILLGLLFVAIVGKFKMKSRLEKLERKAYEEEALQVSMVGHLRAPTAAASRTAPTIENDFKPFAF